MSRTRSSSLRISQLGFGAVLIVFTALAIASPARAGFGDLVKKAKDKATKKANPQAEAGEEAAGDEPVVFDSLVLELTEQRVGNIVATFKKAGAAAAGRAELVSKVDKVNEERSKVLEKHGEKIQELKRKRGDIEVCRHDGYQEVQDRRTKEYADKALTDPAILEKFKNIAAENNAAAARGDSAAIRRANAEMMSVILPTHEDSLEVRKKCGSMPPPLPAEVTLAKLDADYAAANESLRAYDQKEAETQAATSGMNRDQLGMALERIRNYRAWRGGKKKDHMRGFSDEEVKALENHIAEVNASIP